MPITVPAHKIAYMALPKAGCSTAKRALAQIDPDAEIPPAEAQDVYTWHNLYPTVRFRPHRWEAVSDHWRFTVVRDPIKRLMSVYTNRVVQFRDLENSRKLKTWEFAHLPKDPDPDMFFVNLEEYLRASSVIRHHVLPAEVFLGRDLKTYDRIYRTEELGQLAADLTGRTGIAVDLTRENRSETALRFEDLAPATRVSLHRRLMREYRLLRDFYDNPLT